MNLSPFLRAPFAILTASALHTEAALENRAESLGPLERYDPYAPAPEFLEKIHGDPRKGLPDDIGEHVQRLSDKSWYLELGDASR